MGILLAFAPFIVFAVLESFAGPTDGLIAAALVSAGLLLRDFLTPGRSPKILEIGTLMLFGGLAAYAVLGSWTGSVIRVRLLIDTGLLLIVLVSMLLGRPFTLQYAREQVPPALWGNPEFVRTNYVITAVWALAFAAVVAADLALLYVPGMPPSTGIVVVILALVGAIKFTGWYPERKKTQNKS